jgi:hypothetical protein
VTHTENVITTCALGGGIQAVLCDRTIHYFGGYYHVRISVSADVPVSAGAFAAESEYQDAVERLGGSVCFSRTLEKMAVPDKEIDAVRQQLLASFDMNMLPYLLLDDFADSFVRSEYRKALQSRPAFQRQSS